MRQCVAPLGFLPGGGITSNLSPCFMLSVVAMPIRTKTKAKRWQEMHVGNLSFTNSGAGLSTRRFEARVRNGAKVEEFVDMDQRYGIRARVIEDA